MVKLNRKLLIFLLGFMLILPGRSLAVQSDKTVIVATNAEPGNSDNGDENSEVNAGEEVSIIEEMEDIPFDTETVESDEIYEGSSKIERYGIDGLQKVRYEILLQDGVEVSRKRIGVPEIVTEPVSQIVLVGTRPKETEEANTLLESVDIVGAKLNEEFNPEIKEYALSLNEGVDRISFFAKAQDPNSEIEGIESVYISDKRVHSIKVKGIDGTSTIYKFTWEAPEAIVFKYREDNGEIVDLSYDENKELNLDGLTLEEIVIRGQKFKVYKDGKGNTLIGLTGGSSKYSAWYLYKDEEDIKKLGSLISVNSNIYEIVQEKNLQPEILDKYNLSSAIVEYLGAPAFKLNKKELEGKYILALRDLKGQNIWFVFDEKTKDLEEFSKGEDLDEKTLDKIFGQYLGKDWNKAGKINFNLPLIVIVILSIIVILTIVLIVLLIKAGRDKEEIEDYDQESEDLGTDQNPDNLFEVDDEAWEEEVIYGGKSEKSEKIDRLDKTEIIKKIDEDNL